MAFANCPPPNQEPVGSWGPRRARILLPPIPLVSTPVLLQPVIPLPSSPCRHPPAASADRI